VWRAKDAQSIKVKYWEIIADNLSKKPVGVGAASQPWITKGERSSLTDAHRDDGKRFAARADEKLTAFVELGSAIRASVHKNQIRALRPASLSFVLGRVVVTGAQVSKSPAPFNSADR